MKAKKITYANLLTNRRAMVGAISAVFAMVFMLFMGPIMADYLELELGVSQGNVGFIMALPCLVYSIACAVVGLFTKFIPRVYLTEMAFLITFVGMLMFGPSKTLDFPKELALSASGICIVAFSCALIFVPLLSEIVEAVMAKEGLDEPTEELNDIAAGFFNTAYALGCLIAPIIGGALNDAYGFRITCDIMAFSSGGYSIVFLVIAIVPYIMTSKKVKKQTEIMESLGSSKDSSAA